MKILFLDWDGVGNNSKTPTTQKGDTLIMADPYCTFLINRLVDRTGCKVVLSSAWRHLPDWKEDMKAQGLIFEFLDRTPKLGETRGHQIQEWLDKHSELTDNYAIVDDDSDMLSKQRPNFFKTKWETGITEEIALRIEKHFSE